MDNRTAHESRHPSSIAGPHLDRIVGRDSIRRQQPEHVSAEPAADDPRPQRPRALQPQNRLLDRRRRDLVAVAQAGVRGVDQPPELRHVAALERRHRLVDPRVLGDHVAARAGAAAPAAVEPSERRLAQARDPEQLAGLRALGAPLVVARRRRSRGCSPESSVTSCEPAELERDRAHLERAEVDPQRAVGLAEQRRDLVEQAGLRAHPVVLDPRAQLAPAPDDRAGAPLTANSASTSATSSAADDDRPAPRGTVAGDLERRATERHAGAEQLAGRAPDERPPAARRLPAVEREAVALAQIGAAASIRGRSSAPRATVTPSLIANGSASPWL